MTHWRPRYDGSISTCEVQDLLIGEEGWATPWTMDVDSQRRPWLTPRFMLVTEPRGTATMLVKRTPLGYTVDLMLRPDTYENRDYMWGEVRTNFVGMIPVISPSQIPESRVRGHVPPNQPDAELVAQKKEMVRRAEPGRYIIKSMSSTEVCEPCAPDVEPIEADALSAASTSAATAALNMLQAELDKPAPDPAVFLKDEDRKYLEFFGADLSKIGKPSAELAMRPTLDVVIEQRRNRRHTFLRLLNALIMLLAFVSLCMVGWHVLSPSVTVTPAQVDTPAQVAELCGNAKEAIIHHDLCASPR